MTKTMISARIPKKLDESIGAIAAHERRSKSFIVEEALEFYTRREEWMIRRAEASLRRADESGEWHSHESVMKYFSELVAGKKPSRPKADVVRSKKTA